MNLSNTARAALSMHLMAAQMAQITGPSIQSSRPGTGGGSSGSSSNRRDKQLRKRRINKQNRKNSR